MNHHAAINHRREADVALERSALRVAGPAWARWSFLEPSWLARCPVAPVVMAFVLDVYTALTSRLAVSGFPLDGRVEFSAFSLLDQLDRFAPTTKDGNRVFGPGGSAYNDLGRALDHLAGPWLSGQLAQLPAVEGEPPPGEFRVLADYRIGGGGGERTYVTFSGPYMRHLLTASRLAVLDRSTYRSLSPGFPRALYRLLAGEYPDQHVSYPGAELLLRLGSSQQTGSRSRLRQRLGKAHHELLREGVLANEPDIRKAGGVWYVSYDIGRHRAAWLGNTRSLSGMFVGALAAARGIHDNTALLAIQAEAYGVNADQALALATSQPRALARALAATALGILWPWKGLPHMVVRYAREEHPIVDMRGRIRPRKSEPGRDTGAGYLLKTATRRQQHLAAASHGREKRPVGWIPGAAARIALELGVGDEPWVREGLEAVLLQQHLDLPAYHPP